MGGTGEMKRVGWSVERSEVEGVGGGQSIKMGGLWVDGEWGPEGGGWGVEIEEAVGRDQCRGRQRHQLDL